MQIFIRIKFFLPNWDNIISGFDFCEQIHVRDSWGIALQFTRFQTVQLMFTDP